MAIHSTHGSGLFGHLAIIMADADYTALTGQAFIAPIHPGDTPIHAVAATNAQIMETNHQFLADHSEHKLFLMVSQELKKQLLAAIATIYLLPLQHETLGFTTVLCAAMLTHLSATYGVITPDQLKDNCDKLEAPWNPNDPIEGLWECIHECQHLATVGGDPITAPATVHSILDVLEKTGIFADAIHDWQKHPLGEWTLDNFCTDFTTAKKECLHLLTAQNAGFHGANNTSEITLPSTDLAKITITTATPSDGVSSTMMYYCWMHGLGTNHDHTGITYKNKAEEHQDNAMVTNF